MSNKETERRVFLKAELHPEKDSVRIQLADSSHLEITYHSNGMIDWDVISLGGELVTIGSIQLQGLRGAIKK